MMIIQVAQVIRAAVLGEVIAEIPTIQGLVAGLSGREIG